MKPSVKLIVEETDGSKVVRLYHDFKEIPAGMTAKKCALWMLGQAQEKLQGTARKP